jgi:hypothetical protein
MAFEMPTGATMLTRVQTDSGTKYHLAPAGPGGIWPDPICGSDVRVTAALHPDTSTREDQCQTCAKVAADLDVPAPAAAIAAPAAERATDSRTGNVGPTPRAATGTEAAKESPAKE